MIDLGNNSSIIEWRILRRIGWLWSWAFRLVSTVPSAAAQNEPSSSWLCWGTIESLPIRGSWIVSRRVASLRLCWTPSARIYRAGFSLALYLLPAKVTRFQFTLTCSVLRNIPRRVIILISTPILHSFFKLFGLFKPQRYSISWKS